MGLFGYFWLKMKTGRSCCLGWLRPVAFVDPLLLRLALDDSSVICHYELMIVMIVMICHSHQKPFTRIRCKLWLTGAPPQRPGNGRRWFWWRGWDGQITQGFFTWISTWEISEFTKNEPMGMSKYLRSTLAKGFKQPWMMGKYISVR